MISASIEASTVCIGQTKGSKNKEMTYVGVLIIAAIPPTLFAPWSLRVMVKASERKAAAPQLVQTFRILRLPSMKLSEIALWQNQDSN